MARIEKSIQGLKWEDKEEACPECGCKEIVYDKGERFCKKCGYVLE